MTETTKLDVAECYVPCDHCSADHCGRESDPEDAPQADMAGNCLITRWEARLAAAEAEVASLRSRVAELERWQGEAVPVLGFLLTLVPADVEVPESVWKLLERGEAQAIEAPG